MKSFARIISVFLSMLMVLYVIPAEVYSLKTGATELAIDNIEATDNVLSTEAAKVTALGEDISKRTASSKTIRMSDGSYRLVQYASDVHYEDNGEWVEYDNSLSLSSASSSGTVTMGGITAGEPIGYQAASNPSGLKFGQSTTGSVMSFSEGGKKLAMSIQGAKAATITPQEKSIGVISLDKFEEIVTIENYSSSVLYSGVFDNAHIRYTVAGGSVKEDIIVFKKADSYVYSFDFTLTGLDAELLPDGSIAFNDTITDEMMYYIPVGYMYDNSDNASSAVSYSLTQTTSGCTVTVTADAEWINADERIFPVVIDPTVYRTNHSQYSNMKDVDISTAYSATSSTSTWAYMYAGNKSGKEYHSLVGIKELPTLPEASVVTKATLTLKSLDQSGTPIIAAYAVKTPWESSTVRWGDLNNEVLEYDANVVDYQKIERVGEEYVFDITSLAQEWYRGNADGKSSANGVVLKAYSNTANTYAKFSTVNNYTAGNNYFTPLFTIQYRDTKGIEARWSYNSQSAGNAGIGSVNLFTGNLVFAHDDITTNGEILPLTVSHVYNTHQVAQQFTAVTNEIHTVNYSNMTVGYGFKLSIQETIVEKTIDDIEWYIYNDADGTELYFFKPQNETKYVSEDGYDITIEKNADGTYTMSDKVGNAKRFDNSGRFYEQTDLFGNKKTITYQNGRITAVKHTTAANVTTTQLTFTYNDAGALKKIANAEDASESVTFYYSTEYNSSISTSYAGYLREIVQSKGNGSCTYEYDEDGKLIVAKDTATGSKLQYDYNDTMDNGYATVSAVSEHNASSLIGQKIGFIYGAETTAVRTSGNDDAYDTSDDLLTHYVFDDHGRTISAYSSNLDNTEVYGASNAVYSETVQGSKKNHTITKDSVSGVPAVNLLKNHNLESTGSWNGYYSGTGYSSSRSTEKAYIGTYSYKLTSTASKATGHIDRRQSVSITEAGTYTLSAYVKTVNLDANTGFYLKLGTAISRYIKANTDSSIQDGWQRISVTAELAAGTYDVRMVLEKAIGTAYVDCLQLEKGSGASKYNLIENGGVIGSSTGWTATGTIYSEGQIALAGSPSATVTAYQTIPVNRPVTTTFVLSGWANAYSVARRVPEDENEEDTPERNFDLVATLYYDNDTTEEVAASFSTDSTALQFASGAVVSKDADSDLIIESIKVAIHYDYNANTAYFDNICLAMEPAQTYLYDNEGNLTSATNADGNQIDAEYDDDEIDLLSYTNIVGEKFTCSYHADIDHVLAGIIKSDGNGNYLYTSYEYDAYGNVEKEILVGTDRTNSTGNLVTETSYDSYGRVQSVTDTLGKTTTYNRNSATELLNYVIDANENRTSYDYDGKERLIGIFNDKDADGSVDINEENVIYTYNDKDQLTSINNGSTTYTFTYDGYGNVTTIKAGTYTLAAYEYNGNNGKLTKTTYGNGLTITNVYDNLDRLVEVKYNNTVAYTVSYNGDGAISKVVDNRSGITTEYEYDSLGRLIFAIEYETSSKTVVLQTENKYDSFGRPLGSSYDLPDIDIGYSVDYKDNSNLIEGFLQHNTSDMELNGKFYTYDTLERLTSVRVVMDGLTVYNESYTYVSANGRTSSLVATHTVGGVVYSYTYDDIGNITSVSENGTLRANYYYDTLGQLEQVNYYSDRYYSEGYYDIYEYFYDKSGNITNAYHHYGPDVLYSDSKTYTYSNTSWGDLLTAYNGTAITYDSIGNPTKWRNATAIEWYGRQMSLFAHNDSSLTYYSYNADGIRTGKQFVDANGNTTNTVKYTLDGSTIVAENRNGTNIYYTYDDKGSIMGMIYGDETYMFSKNLQGDVIGIYNESRQLVAKYSYNAFGEITAITDAGGNDISGNATHIANINPFRYRGYYYDAETGFYYLESRYYDPVVGRFLNADGIIGSNGDIIGYNMFSYCSNNPVNCVDIEGYWSLKNAWEGLKKGVKKACDVVAETAQTVYKVVVEPVVETLEEAAEVTKNVIEDISNLNPFNTDEQKVLNSHYFSMYKGCLTIRTNMDRSGSFGILFINQKADADTVRHEYGHVIQLALLGPIKFLTCIGLPSWQKWGSDPYYDKPWEVTADIFGGVQSRTHSKEKIDAGFEYLYYSNIYGPFVWTTIN